VIHLADIDATSGDEFDLAQENARPPQAKQPPARNQACDGDAKAVAIDRAANTTAAVCFIFLEVIVLLGFISSETAE
jgi:hypothetical protein